MPRSTNRDDFTAATKKKLAERAGYRCSVPTCRATTSGPQLDPEGSVNVGKAAHITAAAPDGPRYDPTLTPGQRRHISNGIWACGLCADVIDKDKSRYTVADLRGYKRDADAEAAAALGKPPAGVDAVSRGRLRDERMRVCGPVLASIERQLNYIAHWRMLASDSRYIGVVLAPYPQPIVAAELTEAAPNTAEMVVAVHTALLDALDRLSRFQATVSDVREWHRTDAAKHPTKDCRDEYFSSLSSAEIFLDEANAKLLKARELLQTYVGDPGR